MFLNFLCTFVVHRHRHGMGIRTGIDLDKLIDAGTLISDVLGRESRSKAAQAIVAKRLQS